MASRNFRDVQSLHRELKLISGTVTTDSGGAPVSTTGLGFTATNPAEGVYTITFDDSYTDCLYAHACDLDTTADVDSSWYVDAKSGTAVSFNRNVAGTNTDIDSLTFMFTAHMLNSAVD